MRTIAFTCAPFRPTSTLLFQAILAKLGVAQVTVIDEDAKEGLYEQAATQAGVPVVCRKEPLKNIDRMMPQTADAVVILSRLQEVDDLSAFLKVVHKLLRKGGRCGTGCVPCW